MAESAETRKLSGLARSIDALFSTAPPASKGISASATVIATPPAPTPQVMEVRPAAVPEVISVEPAQLEVALVETLITPRAASHPAPPVVEPARPVRMEMFPASQVLDAIEADPWSEAATVPPPVESALAPWSAPSAPDIEFQPDLSAPMDLSVPTGPSAEERLPDEIDPRAFPAAVRAFLAGVPEARERVESLAGPLRERLALDPLADGVEALVRAAGESPDTRHLDLASSVINPAVASRLVQRMGHEFDEVRRAEYLGLCRRLGLVMANALKGALTGALDRDVRRVYHAALISMGETSRPVIEGMVADENRFLVRDAMTMLGEMSGPRAVELVTSALADTDARVRAEALQALGKLGDAKAGQLVLGSLDDPDPDVRVAAAVASGQLGLERALRPLVHMLEGEDDPDVCIPLLRALGQLGDPGAVIAIEKHAVPSMFSKPSTEVRVAAYRALHEIGTPHARDLIKQTAHDKDPAVRVALRDLTRAV